MSAARVALAIKQFPANTATIPATVVSRFSFRGNSIFIVLLSLCCMPSHSLGFSVYLFDLQYVSLFACRLTSFLRGKT